MYRFFISEQDKYHEFKSFKVYWAYRERIRERLANENNDIKIDRILKEDGWERQEKDFSYYSSMEVVRSGWKKGSKLVVTGLHAKGYPPTLIMPLPKAVLDEYHNQSTEELWSPEDPFTIEWIQNTPDEEIKQWLNSL